MKTHPSYRHTALPLPPRFSHVITTSILNDGLEDRGSITLPLLRPDGDEAVEEHVAQRDGGEQVHVAAVVDNLEAVGEVLLEGPADDESRLPAEPADLLELGDVRHGDVEDGRVRLGLGPGRLVRVDDRRW